MDPIESVTSEIRRQIREEAAAGATEAVKPWILAVAVIAIAAYLKK